MKESIKIKIQKIYLIKIMINYQYRNLFNLLNC